MEIFRLAGGFSNSVYRIATSNNAVKNIPVGNHSNAIAFDPRNGDTYMTVRVL